MQLNKRAIAGLTLTICVIALLSIRIFQHEPHSFTPSVIGTWGMIGVPAVPRRMPSAAIPTGQPIEQLALNSDGTGKYVFAYCPAIPFTWSGQGNNIVLSIPNSLHNGKSSVEKGTLSPDKRTLTITSRLAEMSLRNLRESWRWILFMKKPPTIADRFRRLPVPIRQT